MTNAKKEFTREEVEELANAIRGYPYNYVGAADMLDAFAARLAEDEKTIEDISSDSHNFTVDEILEVEAAVVMDFPFTSHGERVLCNMLKAYARDKAEDEASKPVWVNSKELERAKNTGSPSITRAISISIAKSSEHDTPLYTRSKP